MLAVERRVLLREQVEDAVEGLGDEPYARVADLDLGSVARGPHAHLDGPAARRELRRVHEKVPDDLREAGLIALDPERLRLQAHVKPMRVLLHQRAVGLDRPPDDVPEIEAQGQERDLAARHPGHVEQVVEDTRRVRDRTVDHVADGLEARLGCTEAAQERDGDGCEGIPQLVRQHCEELILGGARGFDLLVEPRVLRLEMPLPQVGADLARNDRQQPQVLLGVRARRLPHVEQADEVGRDDRKHQVGGVRELSNHLG